MREALRALGPYFAVDDPPSARGWRPVVTLLDSPEQLLQRSTVVRDALGGESVPLRVAVSVAQLSIVARLLAPSFAAAVLEGRLLDPQGGWWHPEPSGPMALALTDDAVDGPLVDGDLAAALHERVIEQVVAPVVGHGVAMSVSPLVLWGNVASAVAGAAAMVGRARPAVAGSATALATQLLRLGRLRGTALDLPDVTGVADVQFRRRSCCLLYRIAPPGTKNLCGDCILRGVTREPGGH